MFDSKTGLPVYRYPDSAGLTSAFLRISHPTSLALFAVNVADTVGS
jgi:hypothetical protein